MDTDRKNNGSGRGALDTDVHRCGQNHYLSQTGLYSAVHHKDGDTRNPSVVGQRKCYMKSLSCSSGHNKQGTKHPMHFMGHSTSPCPPSSALGQMEEC